MYKNTLKVNVRFFLTLFLFGLLLSACETESLFTEEPPGDLTEQLDLRNENGCFNVVRDFCAPGECCTYTVCTDFVYGGDGNYTLTSPSYNVLIVQHELVIGEPICWTVVTCTSTSLTLKFGNYTHCTESVKCGNCPATFTFNEQGTNNLQTIPGYEACCMFNFSIYPVSIPSGCSLVVESGPIGGAISQNGLNGRVRVCPDEDVNLVLECEDGTSCHVCTPDVTCP